ncbi:MAG: exonuclease SbcCD subunit D, partial [Bacteroidales bacterium]|nr:exonuclease SbcCD subunit D [Bacteroidales bacterium]
MKILHTSDLHLGIRIYERSLLEDQKVVLAKIVETAQSEQTDVCLIAGDVFDRSVASEEAVCLFDDFLTRLKEARQKVIVISGNHDSAERIAFGNRIMNAGGLYLSPVYTGRIEPVLLEDGYGTVAFHPIPFLKPANVRPFTGKELGDDYNLAMQHVVGSCTIDRDCRNVAVVHQFITNAEPAGSERRMVVGGVDNVEASIFKDFDYVALGHLHRAQHCGEPHIRYSGTPMPYSFAESNDEKSVSIIEMKGKGNLEIKTIPITPPHAWKMLRGTFAELTDPAFYRGHGWEEAYMHITLTDEEDVYDAMGRLRSIYPNLMELRYDNSRTRSENLPVEAPDADSEKRPADFIRELYRIQNNTEMNMEQEAYLQTLIRKIW